MDNYYLARLKNSLLEQVGDFDFENFKPCGNTYKAGIKIFKRHMEEFKIEKYKNELPKHMDKCSCGKIIKYNFYIYHTPTKQIAIVGSECINHFMSPEQLKLMCIVCKVVAQRGRCICKKCTESGNQIINFGRKYKGLKTYLDVFANDKSYLIWAINTIDFKKYMPEFLARIEWQYKKIENNI